MFFGLNLHSAQLCLTLDQLLYCAQVVVFALPRWAVQGLKDAS
jgi:hypothetical protein